MNVLDIRASLRNRPLGGVDSHRGFTLTEIAIVLGIIGAVLGAIWVAAARVNDNQKIADGVAETLAIASGVRALYPSGQIRGGGQSLGGFLINAGNIVPVDKIGSCSGLYFGAAYGNGTKCILSPWGGQIIVMSQMGNGGLPVSSSRFQIDFEGTANHPLPCAAFFGVLVPAAASAGLVEVNITSQIMTVSSRTPPTTFANCSDTGGGFALQFQL